MAKKAAEGKTTVITCPSCGEDAQLTSAFADRYVYSCPKCKADSVFTKLPDNLVKTEPKKEKKLGSITLRDRSKENKKPQKENVEQKQNVDVPKDVKETVSAIRQGMDKKKIITFDYKSSDGSISSRNVEPYKLTRDKSGNLIMYAFCLEGEGIRAFKLVGMSVPKETEYDYKARWPLEDLLKVDNGRG